MRKRGANSWQLIVFNGFDSRGRRQYSRKTVHGTKKEAELLLAVYVLEVGHRAATSWPRRRRLPRCSMAGWSFVDRSCRRRRSDRYRIAINHVRPALGKMAVVRLETHHLDDFYAKLHREGMSGASVRKIHWAMRQSLVWAKRRGYVTHLATEGVELPPLGATQIQPPTSDVVSRLLDSALANDPEFGTIFAFVAWTGCRRGEVCSLQWRDIDFERSELLFDRSVVVRGTVGEDDKDQRVTAYRHRSGHDRVTGGARVAKKDDRGAVRRSNQRSWVCVLTRSVDGRALASDDDQPSVRFGMQGGGDPAHAATRPSSSLGNGTSEEWGQRRRGDGSSRVEDDGHGVAIPPHDGSDGPRCRRIT